MEDLSVKVEGEHVVASLVKPEGEVVIKLKLVAILEKVSVQTENKLDDKAVEILKAILAKV